MNIKRILQRMKHVYRVRRLVKIVYEETNNPSLPLHDQDNRPTVVHALAAFTQLNKKYTSRIAMTTMTIATGDGYLAYQTSRDHSLSVQRVVVKAEGLKLLTSRIYYINELAGAVGKVSPIIAVLVSILALIVSIIAINAKG